MNYLISISSLLFDLSANVLIKTDKSRTRMNNLSRRISRTATLDGGAVIVDNGYSPSDATFEIFPANLIKSQIDIFNWIIKYHSQIIIDCEYGSFVGTIKSIEESQNYKITFLVKSTLNEE